MKQQHFTVIGWIMFLLFLYFLSKSKSGYSIIYFGLVLVLAFLVLNNYKAIEAVMVSDSSNQNTHQPAPQTQGQPQAQVGQSPVSTSPSGNNPAPVVTVTNPGWYQ